MGKKLFLVLMIAGLTLMGCATGQRNPGCPSGGYNCWFGISYCGRTSCNAYVGLECNCR